MPAFAGMTVEGLSCSVIVKARQPLGAAATAAASKKITDRIGLFPSAGTGATDTQSAVESSSRE